MYVIPYSVCLCLTYFTYHNAFRVRPCCCKWQKILTIVACAIFSLHRLVEIAESRFPRYFDTEEKLLLTSSKVHLYRELSCDEVLQRYAVLDFGMLVILWRFILLFFMFSASEWKKSPYILGLRKKSFQCSLFTTAYWLKYFFLNEKKLNE